MRFLMTTAAAAALLFTAHAASTPAELQGLWTYDYASPANEALTPEAAEGGSLRGFSFNFSWETPIYDESFDGLSALYAVKAIKPDGQVTVFELESLADGTAKTVAYAFPGDDRMLVISEMDAKISWVFKRQSDVDAAPKLDLSFTVAKSLSSAASGLGPRFRALPPGEVANSWNFVELRAAACTETNAAIAEFDIFNPIAPSMTIGDGQSEPATALIRSASYDPMSDTVTLGIDTDGKADTLDIKNVSEAMPIIGGKGYADCYGVTPPAP